MADVTFLSSQPRFKPFSAQDLAFLGKVCEERSLKAGKDIYQQDAEEEVTAVFFVKTGTVSLHKAMDGKDRELGKLSVGEFFGESSLISPAPHSLTVRAETDVTLVFFDQHAYETLQKDSPATAFKVLDVFIVGLVERLREADARLITKFKKEGAAPAAT